MLGCFSVYFLGKPFFFPEQKFSLDNLVGSESVWGQLQAVAALLLFS